MYFVKNKSGKVSPVNKDLYAELQKSDEFECWIEQPNSTNYTVREVLEKVEGMSADQINAFCKGDERKTIKALTNG